MWTFSSLYVYSFKVIFDNGFQESICYCSSIISRYVSIDGCYFIFLIINIFLNVIHGRGEISKKQTTWLLYLQEKCKSNCPPRGFRTGTCVAFDNHPVADCCGVMVIIIIIVIVMIIIIIMIVVIIMIIIIIG